MNGIQGKKFSLLKQRFGSIYGFFSASSKEANSFLQEVGINQTYISREYLLEQAHRELERWEKNCHVYCVSMEEDLYPLKLSQVPNPPPIIFLRLLQLQRYEKVVKDRGKKWISIVGTRNSDSFSNRIAHDAAKELATKEAIIVSGLAKGIDVNAHVGAMKGGENTCTIAVFGCGVLYVYPKSNVDVYRKMVERGDVVLSEYLPEEPPTKYYFPMRNRIMAALSDAVIVIQAPFKSGVRITVDFALEMGKDVYVYKPEKKSTEYELNFYLLEDGAQGFSNKDELLELFSLASKQKSPDLSSKLSNDAKTITDKEILFQILEKGPMQIEDICKKMNTPEHRIVPLLMRYLISGDIIETSGNRFYKSAL